MRKKTTAEKTALSKISQSPLKSLHVLKKSLPAQRDWRTTDEDEINRRKVRAVEEKFTIRNTNSAHPVFSNFSVKSSSGLTYEVEVRDVVKKQVCCTCSDYRKNGLGTCKHVEAVLCYLEARRPRLWKRALQKGSNRIDIMYETGVETLKVERGYARLPRGLKRMFDADGLLAKSIALGDALQKIAHHSENGVRLSQEVGPLVQRRMHEAERMLLRREYERKVASGEYPPHETTVPLYPYQREGMLHLAFTERALLADEMGLGKTIQAIAACALLLRLGKAKHALLVTPASLKTEWEEQIQKFTALPYTVVFGPRRSRVKAYNDAPFFTIVNYEQVRSDSLDINAALAPDIVVLDEAQRIKNWSTSTAQAVKRLKSRFAFVLTGTPIENRIDEIYSIVDFLDPAVFGPLFRFNREFYIFDDRGRPLEYKNLQGLRERIKPIMLRRRKADVETELPERSDRNFFVPMSKAQLAPYDDHQAAVARLMATAKRHPLTKQQQDKLMRELAMMRMLCDTTYILDPNDTTCPKLQELENILDELLSDEDVKVVLFSEWVRMLELVKEMCEKKHWGYAWHTGSVPQRRRRAEIQLFKTDPACRIFICSESGGVGLNLQSASVVINCDLPWNPAKLEQRIARVWRKHQVRPVDVINLISENTIENRMLDTLAAKQGLADGVLDGWGKLDKISMRGGSQNFMKRLQQVMMKIPGKTKEKSSVLPVDRAAAFADRIREKLGTRMVHCEEQYPLEAAHTVIMVVVDRDAQSLFGSLKEEFDALMGHGKIDPLAPVKYEVVDRAAWDALQRMQKLGLIQKSVRATRVLGEKAPGTLNEEEKLRIEALRTEASQKAKMAKVLHSAGFKDEATKPLTEAVFSYAKAMAVENRLPLPELPEHACANPLVTFWGDRAGLLVRNFIEKGNGAQEPLVEMLAGVGA